ncbi:MAG: LysE family translocator [Muribaculaceae bacterium]|nr:LysE family translocator [Muribaculaceae bacterium]
MNFIEALIYMIWRGVAIGIIISAPMGPVGILCVQRTLEKGRLVGLYTGIGAALSDLFYCLVTGFGLSFIEEFLKANQNVIQIIGSAVLIIFGIYLFRSNPSRSLKKPGEVSSSPKKDILSGFLFTFSNPLIIFLIIGLFARFNFLLPEITWLHYIVGFLSIISGALIWWWIVTFFVNKVRTHFNLRSMWLINKIMGSVIIIFGLVGVFTAISEIASARDLKPAYISAASHDKSRISEIKLPLQRAREFNMSFRCCTEASKRRTDRNWQIVAWSDADTMRVNLNQYCPWADEHALSQVTARVGDSKASTTLGEASGLDRSPWVSWRLRRSAEGHLTLQCGRTAYNLLSEWHDSLPYDSIAILPSPGSDIILDHIALTGSGIEWRADRAFTHFANPDVRKSYFARSLDPIEGEWEIFDHSLDNSLLQLGGAYKLAIAAEGDNYRIIYLGGAKKLLHQWNAGDTKGRLLSSAFADVYDMEWLDPQGNPVAGAAKAQYEAPDILTLHFPAHNSTLRLRRVGL